jgi:hypothetical protein
MKHLAEMRRCLMECDCHGIRALWRHISPHLPQPETDEEALKTLHLARTLTRSIPVRYRMYSHAWLRDHDLPSGLPDKLRPKAERIYPPVVEAVGIATKNNHAVARAIRKAMEDVVMDHYSTDRVKRPDPVVVKRDMLRVRDDVKRHLGLKE